MDSEEWIKLNYFYFNEGVAMAAPFLVSEVRTEKKKKGGIPEYLLNT